MVIEVSSPQAGMVLSVVLDSLVVFDLAFGTIGQHCARLEEDGGGM